MEKAHHCRFSSSATLDDFFSVLLSFSPVCCRVMASAWTMAIKTKSPIMPCAFTWFKLQLNPIAALAQQHEEPSCSRFASHSVKRKTFSLLFFPCSVISKSKNTSRNALEQRRLHGSPGSSSTLLCLAQIQNSKLRFPLLQSKDCSSCFTLVCVCSAESL